MLVKLYPILQGFARRKEETVAQIEHTEHRLGDETVKREISHKEWINADRIVMLILIIGVIIAAIIFS